MAQTLNSFDTGLVGKALISDQFKSIGQKIGSPDLSAGTEFQYGGNLYRVSDDGSGRRIINNAGSLAEIESNKIKAEQAKATKAALSTLESGKETIGSIYDTKEKVLQSELDPTKQRYEQLLEEITRRETVEKTGATKNVNRELARRGILSNSGFADQEMQGALSPIQQFYTGQVKETGLAQDNALRAIQNAIAMLGTQEAEQLLGLNRDISGMQFAGGTNAAQTALQILTQREQASQNQAQMALQEAMNQINAGLSERSIALDERKFNEYELPLLNYNLAKPYYKPTGGGGGASSFRSELDNLWSTFKIGNQNAN